MGTTESLFQDHADPDGRSSTFVSAHPGAMAGSHHPQVLPHRHQQQEQQQQSPGSKAKHSVSSRMAGRSGAAAGALPILRLSGIVLGMSHSGKQTLLQRLEGKDPFAPQQGRKNGGNAGDDSETENTRTECAIPYLPPKDCVSWDRIQLRVKISRSLPVERDEEVSKSNARLSNITGRLKSIASASTSSVSNVHNNNNNNSHNPMHQYDFAVILVNPRHDPSRVADYLADTVGAVLERQGYRHVESGEHADHSVDETTQQQQQQEQRRPQPVCLCLLLTFRDLFDQKKRASSGWLEESDVRSLTMEVLQQYPGLEWDRLVLQCSSVSLQNCYGLSVLHHFMYQSYLQRKQSDLEEWLVAVHQAHATARSSTPFQSYEDYMKLVLNQSGGIEKSSSSSRQHKHDKGRESKRQSKQHRKQGHHAEEQEQQEQEETSGAAPSSRRKIVPDSYETPVGTETADDDVNKVSNHAAKGTRHAPGKHHYHQRSARKATPLSYATGKEALEAFLASEDEEEEGTSSKNNKQPAAARAQSKSDDDDDDDDEFFYDERGQRRYSGPKATKEVQGKKESPQNVASTQQNRIEQHSSVSSLDIQEASDKKVPGKDGTPDGNGHSSTMVSNSTSRDNSLVEQPPAALGHSHDASQEFEGETGESSKASDSIADHEESGKQQRHKSTDRVEDEEGTSSVPAGDGTPPDSVDPNESTGGVRNEHDTPIKTSSQNSLVPERDSPVEEQTRQPSTNEEDDTASIEDKRTKEEPEALARSTPAAVNHEWKENSDGGKVGGKDNNADDENDDDDDDFVIDYKTQAGSRPSPKDDDDDDDFFIATTSTIKAGKKKLAGSSKKEQQQSQLQSKTGGGAASGGGLSSAALAAIAAAKEEAELLLQQQQHVAAAAAQSQDVGIGGTTKKMKKKKKDDHPEKKEKKEKSKKSKGDVMP